MNTIKRNYIFNLAYQVLILIVPLITAPYLSRVLGADKIGEYSFAQSIVSYFSLVAVLGTSLYGQRTISYERSRGGNIRKTFLEILSLRIVGTFISTLCYFLFIVCNVDNKILYIVAVIELIAVIFDISWFYQGIEKFQTITIYNGISKVIGTCLIFTFVRTKSDLVYYVLFYCGTILLGNILQWLNLKKVLPNYKKEDLNIKVHLLPSFALFVSQLAIQLYTVLDKTMIGLITKSNYENGYYEQSQKLVKMATTIVTAIGAVMASRIAVLYGEGYEKNKYKIKKLLEFSFRLVFCTSIPIAVGIRLVASRFVPLFYGNGYDEVIPMLSRLSIIVPIIGCSNIIGIQLFVPSKRENLLTKSVFVGSCINVILNIFLIKRYAAMGAIIASVIAEFGVTCVQFYFAKDEISLKTTTKLFVRYTFFSVVMYYSGKILSSTLDYSVFSMLIIISVCVIIYATELIVSKDPILTFVFNKET